MGEKGWTRRGGKRKELQTWEGKGRNERGGRHGMPKGKGSAESTKRIAVTMVNNTNFARTVLIELETLAMS